MTVDTSSDSLSAVASVGDRYALAYTFDNLTVRGGGVLALFDPLTILGTTQLIEGSKLTHLDINSNLYLAGLDLFTQTLTVAADSAFNVDGRGYMGGCRPGNALASGLSQGFTPGSTGRAGGSYGGLGGVYSGQGTPNAVYGSSNNPVDLGAGGGCSSGWDGGDGGGLIRVVANSAVIDGLISANGTGAQGNISGDGAGGGINLTFGTLSGSGTIRANGGASQSGGGGGRVFINATTNSLAPSHVTAAGGVGSYTTGQAGSVVIQ